MDIEVNSTRVPARAPLLSFTNLAPTENLGLLGPPRPFESSEVVPEEMFADARQSPLNGAPTSSEGNTSPVLSWKQACVTLVAAPPAPDSIRKTTLAELPVPSLARSVRALPSPASAHAVTHTLIEDTVYSAG